MTDQTGQLKESQVTKQGTETPSLPILSCLSCDYTSTNKHYLRQHVDLAHSTDRPFKCPFCDYAGKRSHALKEHLVVHSDERPYQCTQCNATFRKKGHLTNHYRMHSEAKTIAECDLCAAKPFQDREKLYVHLRSAHRDVIGRKVFCCNRCSYATTTPGSLHVHEMAHDDFRNIVLIKPKLPPSTNVILKCSDCGFETTQRTNFEKHVLEEHMSGGTGETATSKGAGNRVLPSRLVTARGGIYTCLKPDKDGKTDGEKLKMNKCHQCGFVTDNYRQLILHIVSHKDSMKEAEVADAKSRREPDIAALNDQSVNSRSFTEKDGVYICNICNYDCESQRVIKAHMWKHSGHKDLCYPTFQNGPLSVYDGTPLEAKNFINKDRESVKALFQQSERGDDSNRDGREGDEDSVLAAKRYLDDISNNNKSLDTMARSDPSTSAAAPKVIVQRIHQTDHISPSSYPTGLEYSESVTPSEPATAAGAAGDASMAAAEERPLQDNPLQVMTAVCEAVSSRSTEASQQNQVPGNAAQQWSASEKTAATLLSLLRQGPNINPACPPPNHRYGDADIQASDGEVAKEVVVVTDGHDSGSSDSGVVLDRRSEASSPMSKPKSGGICSSLLAVIEQLRERQAEDDTHRPSQALKTRRKRKLNATTDSLDAELLASAEYLNCEQVETTSNGVMYRCKLCHYQSTASLMKQHLRMHKHKQPHECSLCDFIAASSSTLQDHMIQHCKMRQFQCKRCSAVFGYKSQLRAHMRVHEEGHAFYCDHCEYITSDVKSFQEHITHHWEAINTFTCIACRKKFSDLDTLQQHMKEECVEAKKLYNSKQVQEERTGDNRAGASTAAAEPAADNMRRVKCDQCDFVALSVRSLKSHTKRHVNDKRYIQQPLEQYKCNMCGYVCHHMPSLKSHMWRHASDTNFSYSFTNILSDGKTPVDKDGKPLITLRCCQCGFETVSKSELDSHMQSHLDIIKKTFDVGK